MKYTTIYGIDVAKKTFDVSTIDGEHLQFVNTEKGFQAFFKTYFYYYTLRHGSYRNIPF